MTPPREPDARKIDAEVAVKVMGWRPDREWPSELFWTQEREQKYNFCPSSDIADAMAVLEKMRERGCVARIENGLAGAFEVTFFLIHKRIHPDNEFYQAADTLPMAICLCALRAVGAERKD